MTDNVPFSSLLTHLLLTHLHLLISTPNIPFHRYSQQQAYYKAVTHYCTENPDLPPRKFITSTTPLLKLGSWMSRQKARFKNAPHYPVLTEDQRKKLSDLKVPPYPYPYPWFVHDSQLTLRSPNANLLLTLSWPSPSPSPIASSWLSSWRYPSPYLHSNPDVNFTLTLTLPWR